MSDEIRNFIAQHGHAPMTSELGRAEDRLRLAKQSREQAARGLGHNEAPWAQRNLQLDVEREERAVAHHKERLGL